MYSVFPVSSVCSAQRQRGAALILALVVFGIVALLATSLSMDFLVSVKRVENQLYSQQADAYMRGAEGLARYWIQKDYKDPNTRAKDHFSEGWLGQPQEYPLEGGMLNGEICDLQGRFNLNNLPGSTGAPGTFTVDQEMFIRLLQTLELEQPLDETAAIELTNAVVDWIDADDTISFPGGAEEGYYSNLEPAYRVGNRPLNSVYELRWVKGINKKILDALQPHVVALPPGVPLNVNTADKQVLRSFNVAGNRSPLADADNIVSARDGNTESGNLADINDGFGAPGELIQAEPALSTLNPANLKVDVKSNYFMLDLRLLFQDRVYTRHAVLARDNTGAIHTLARSQSGLGSCREGVLSP